jgi:hypothetical protein
VASEGILQNIKMHEDKYKISIAETADAGDFEWIGKNYAVTKYEGEYPLNFGEKNMDIPPEHLKKHDQLPDITGLEVTLMGAEKGRTTDIANSLLGNTFRLFINEQGWLAVTPVLSIKEKELLQAGTDLRSYIDHDIRVDRIIKAENTQSVIKAEISIMGD